ncbi:hypothetical protein FH968_08875 [Buttiauxella sp. B2]|uniref:hypothetical protein n=1 Tax=Buttiauxella sp. B2 TaxID=2587812 RepID=UPI00112102FF|nr:hypothetical protein [Buttiauxella sp. B2]TNV21015.1 hypothetical protein FH968_08875 [Buttiauxella sp. B2]
MSTIVHRFISYCFYCLLERFSSVKSLLCGLCCFNSVQSLSSAEESTHENSDDDFSCGWSRLWGCASQSLVAASPRLPIPQASGAVKTIFQVRLVAQLRHELAFSFTTRSVHQLLVCHRLSGESDANSDSHNMLFYRLKSTMRLTAIVLFLLSKSDPRENPLCISFV